MILKRIHHYLYVYKEFLASSFSEATSYRLHFFLLILMDWCFYTSSLLGVKFVYTHVNKIGTWSEPEFLFFIAFMLLVDQIHMAFVAENFWYFSDSIRRGQMDFVLLKPISSVFSTFFRHIRPASFINLPLACILLIWFGHKIGFSWLQWACLPILILIGFSLQVSLEILLSTSMFWLVEGYGINFLRMQFQQVSRWPDFVFQKSGRWIFQFAFPVLMIGNAPTRWLLDKSDFFPLVYCIFFILLTWFLIIRLWRAGLVQYESASS